MSRKTIRELIIGSLIAFGYPAHNYQGIPVDLEPRRCRVLAIVDTRSRPVDKEWIRHRPTLNRGRWLVICEDLDCGEERKFYWERMDCVQELTKLECKTLVNREYCVIEHERVSYATGELGEAIAFQLGRGQGVVCAVMAREPEVA